MSEAVVGVGGARGERGFRGPAAIVHETTGWGMEEHLALRDYLAAHDLLQERPEEVSEAEAAALATRLGVSGASDQELKHVLIFLAHHKSARACLELQRYLQRPERRLERFARLAYEEALQWSEPARRPGRNEPCPCRSGRKFKACCGRGLW